MKKAIIKITIKFRVLCKGIKNMGIIGWLKNVFVRIRNVPLPEYSFTLTGNMSNRSLSLRSHHLNCALKILLLLIQENSLSFLCHPELGKFPKAIPQNILEENIHKQYK